MSSSGDGLHIHRRSTTDSPSHNRSKSAEQLSNRSQLIGTSGGGGGGCGGGGCGGDCGGVCGGDCGDTHPLLPTSLPPLKNKQTNLLASEPEREPLNIEVNLVEAPPELEQLVQNIKQVAEQFLYHWKWFPIILPGPVAQIYSFPTSNVTSDGSLGRSKYHLRDLFVTPTFDRLGAIALNRKGKNRKLTGNQLVFIRERGEFEVESLNFPGKVHRWKLSQLLQKGTERTNKSLLNDMALALRLLIETSNNRMVSHFFSVSEALRSMLEGVWKLLDIFVGITSLQVDDLDAKIWQERRNYLVAELDCSSEHKNSLGQLCQYVQEQLRRAATEKFDIANECFQSPVSVPYRYLTPTGAELDLRLWNRKLMQKVLPALNSILAKETRGWFLHFRERLNASLRAGMPPGKVTEREVNEAVVMDCLQRVYDSILSNSDINNLGDGIAELLVEQAQSFVLMHRAVESVQLRLSKSQETVKSRLCSDHPVLSRIGPWLQSHLKAAEMKFSLENQWCAHEEALALCQRQKLLQATYFLKRDLAFMKEREPAMLREWLNAKTPTRRFVFATEIWQPNNWTIRRIFQDQSEVIPTVLSKQPNSTKTLGSDPSQPVFRVEQDIHRRTNTRWPMWRVRNYFHRTWCWTWNTIFILGFIIPWCSPVGLRALFQVEPFMPDVELSQMNGTLYPRDTSLTYTVCSRFTSLWRHIARSRTNFEMKYDTSFIGNVFRRHWNLVWNYIIKGLFGTIGIVIIVPLLSLLVILSCFFMAATAVFWMPVLTLGVQLTNGLIYDFDSPDIQNRNRFLVLLEALLWNILIQGCLQLSLSILVAIFICPLVSLIILTGGVTRYLFRLLWDAAIFHGLIKKRGRIPACNSFVVKRIAGPGFAPDYYLQISPEQALAALEAKMELNELAAYQAVIENTIVQPQKDFSHFVQTCFGSFSTQLRKNGPYKTLEKEGQALEKVLNLKLEQRRRDLETGLNASMKAKIKLTRKDLKIGILQGALMLEHFYPAHILPKLDCNEEQFWGNHSLSIGDWAGLASLLYTEIFSPDILTPLDTSDTSFRVDPHPKADISRYKEMVLSTKLRSSDPDLRVNVYMSEDNKQADSPFLKVSAFNPRCILTATDKHETQINKTTSLLMPWKKIANLCSSDKLVIPLSVPLPTQIAVTIYNRDTDNPLSLDSKICQTILWIVEENQPSPNCSASTVFSCNGNGDKKTASLSSESVETSNAVIENSKECTATVDDNGE